MTVRISSVALNEQLAGGGVDNESAGIVVNGYISVANPKRLIRPVTVVPYSQKNSQNENSGGNKRKLSETSNSGNSGNSNKNNKKNKTCYNCGKKGHFRKECRSKKRLKTENAGSSHNANVVEDDINEKMSEMQVLKTREIQFPSFELESVRMQAN
ncbi:hypothetical protein RJ640_001422 [Escallonia rubra]|uniref:CCHC-type domain-containing protein n=1 Tax=Escallonia rubra TaxID=112253 RepID=A0AA88QV56_9ASTE|nr:hypothetical protein RJ640_001422 [Escallonia rubra]